jgi:hypothetical protein
MPELTDEKVLNCDGFLHVDPAIEIRGRAERFLATREWSTDQVCYGDQCELVDEYGDDTPPDEDEDVEMVPRWSFCFNLGLDHIRTCGVDWYADVQAIVDFLRNVATETETEFNVDVRYRSKRWYSEHIAIVDGSNRDRRYIKAMIERVT